MTQALIIGASISGLVAAYALSPVFDTVLLLDGDDFADNSGLHKGVAQGGHAHVLLPSGIELMKQLLSEPDLDISQYGILEADAASELRWFHFDVWKSRFQSRVNLGWCNRPLFESQVRLKVLALDNVQIRSKTKVQSLEFSDNGNQVIGVQVLSDDSETLITADLIIDASGRGTRTPKWLKDGGYPEVREDRVQVNLSYTTRIFRFPEEDSPHKQAFWKVLAIYANPPHSRRTGLLYSLDDNLWMVTLVGFHGDKAPGDLPDFLTFTQSLPRPELYQILCRAIPVGEACHYQCPGSLWRRYDLLSRWPANFLVIGDAVSSFNPVYGQGMTAAMMDVQVVKRYLERQPLPSTLESSMRIRGIQRRIGRGKWIPWLMATGSDFIYPETEGERPVGTGLINNYLTIIMKLAAEDSRVHQKFIEVFSLLKSPHILLTPDVLYKVICYRLRPKSRH